MNLADFRTKNFHLKHHFKNKGMKNTKKLHTWKTFKQYMYFVNIFAHLVVPFFPLNCHAETLAIKYVMNE